jgi:hypothetical protein
MRFEEAVDLFTERATKLATTAPLHASSVDVGGIERPRIIVGWALPMGKRGTYSNKLFKEYEKHFGGRKSRLADYVNDVPAFMETMWVYLQDDDYDPEDEGDEREIPVSDKYAEAICLERRIETHNEESEGLILFTTKTYGYESTSRDILGVWVGYVIEKRKWKFGDVRKVLDEAKKKAIKLKKGLPIFVQNELSDDDIEVAIVGNYRSGEVTQA